MRRALGCKFLVVLLFKHQHLLQLLYSLSSSVLVKLTIKLTVCTAVMLAFLLCLMDTQCQTRTHTYIFTFGHLGGDPLPESLAISTSFLKHSVS